MERGGSYNSTSLLGTSHVAVNLNQNLRTAKRTSNQGISRYSSQPFTQKALRGVSLGDVTDQYKESLYFGTEKSNIRAYAPKVVAHDHGFWVSKSSLNAKQSPKMKQREYRSSTIQKDLPYLIKNKFVPLQSQFVNLARYQHENEPDSVLQGFKQSKDNLKVHRLVPNEPITRKNPYNQVTKINICNSFQLNQKAMNQTFRTLMQGDMSAISDKPQSLETAIAMKLQRHFDPTTDGESTQHGGFNKLGSAESTMSQAEQQSNNELNYFASIGGNGGKEQKRTVQGRAIFKNSAQSSMQRRNDDRQPRGFTSMEEISMSDYQQANSMQILPEKSGVDANDLNMSIDADSITSEYQREQSGERHERQDSRLNQTGGNRLNLRQPLQGSTGQNNMMQDISPPDGQPINIINRALPIKNNNVRSSATGSSCSTTSGWRLRQLGPDLLTKADRIEKRVIENFRKQQQKTTASGHIPKTPQHYHNLYNNANMNTNDNGTATASLQHQTESLDGRSSVVRANKARFTNQRGSKSVSRLSDGNSTFHFEGARDSQEFTTSSSKRPRQKPILNQRLLALQEKVHLRKIQYIKAESEVYQAANRQFYKRQENILLNALQFINDVANERESSDEEDGEHKGIDEGFECKLDPEQRERPEFQQLIQEGQQGVTETHIKNYTLKSKNYKRMLQGMMTK